MSEEKKVIRLNQKEEFKARLINCLPSDFIPESPTDDAILKSVQKLSLMFLGVYKEPSAHTGTTPD